jgi:Tol biopolymer transport system component
MSTTGETRLGAYEILGPLGAGGMGEVFRARDTKLGREVALKVLPEAVAQAPERVARFKREAQVLAALNHPNIAAIYGLEEDGAKLALVLELVPGATLEERLRRGAIPSEEAIVIARQIADALEEAHEKGIVHRDLKPANVKVSDDGKVKVLDFGLAKALLDEKAADAPHVSSSPTLTSPTQAGLILGTAAYMAPEQARGRAVDKRADIWAFGVVLFEMLTGRRLFDGETMSDTLAAVLTKDPDWSALPVATGTPVRRLLQRCLVRDPRQRLHDIADARLELEATAPQESSGAPAAPARASRWPTRVGWALAILAAYLATRSGRRAAPGETATNAKPVLIRKITYSGGDLEPSASPDGKLIAFTSFRDGVSRIWLKQLEGGGEQPLTAGRDSRPRFAPDGSSVLYIHDDNGKLLSAERMALVGGQARRVLAGVREADFSPDGQRVAFVRSVQGGAAEALGVATTDGMDERILLTRPGIYFRGVRWSPDGRFVATAQVGLQIGIHGSLLVVDPATGSVKEESAAALGGTSSLAGVTWLNGGAAVLVALAPNTVGSVTNASSRVVRYDLADGRVQDLFVAPNLFPTQGFRFTGAVITRVAPGVVCFDSYVQRETLREIATGKLREERVLTRGTASDRQPAYSPDGRLIAFSSNRSGNLDVWTLNRATGALHQVTDSPAQDWDPAFSADGKHLIFTSDRSGNMEIWIANADGTGARQVSHDGVDAENATMSRDGRWIVYTSGSAAKQGVWRVRPDGSEATRLVAAPTGSPEISPDGRHVSYAVVDAGSLQAVLHVVELETGSSADFTILIHPGSSWTNLTFGRHRWLPDGRALAFLGVDERGRTGILAQDFVAGRDTSASRRKLAGFYDDLVTESLGIAPDGAHLTIAVRDDDNSLMLAENVPGVR